MKKLFLLVALMAINMSVFAEEGYIVRNIVTRDTIAWFDMSDVTAFTAEFTLTEDTNRIEVTQQLNQYTKIWWGPKWPGYSSSKADKDGYCWWTCPDLKVGEQFLDTIDSGSGTNNHIGMIIKPGYYRITFKRVASANVNDFIIERLATTDLPTLQTDNKSVKIMTKGQLFIRRDDKMYDVQGAEIR